MMKRILIIFVALSMLLPVLSVAETAEYVIIPMPEVNTEKTFAEQIDTEKKLYTYRGEGYVVVYLHPLKVDKSLEVSENYTDYATSIGFFPQFFNYSNVHFKTKWYSNNWWIEDITFNFGGANKVFDGEKYVDAEYYSFSVGYPSFSKISDGDEFYPIYVLKYALDEYSIVEVLDILDERGDVYFARPLYTGEEYFYQENVAYAATDTQSVPWYTKYVGYVKDNGIMNGVNAAGDFAPNGQLTRAQLVQILYNMYGNGEKPKESVYDYYDIYHGEWYYDAVCWAIDNYIINGVGDRIMAPNEPITREMFVTLMYRAADTLGLSCENYVTEDISGIADLDTVSEWACEAATWAAEGGLMSGTKVDGEVKWLPQDTCTRAQAAKVFSLFHNYHSAYAPESGMTQVEFYDMLHNR